MQIALAATLLLLVVWFVVLRPKPALHDDTAATPPAAASATPAPTGATAPGAAGLGRAVDKAHGAVTTANGDAARAQQTSADGTAAGRAASGAAQPATSARTGAAATHAAKPPGRHGAAPARRRAEGSQVLAVKSALRHHRAIAIAFVNPRAADARAVGAEIGHVSHFGGRAMTLAVPLSKLSEYDFITKNVEVTVAPTVVIVDPRRRATTIVGFTDRGEIEQRLADALAAKRR
jgi:hypothetical protein